MGGAYLLGDPSTSDQLSASGMVFQHALATALHTYVQFDPFATFKEHTRIMRKMSRPGLAVVFLTDGILTNCELRALIFACILEGLHIALAQIDRNFQYPTTSFFNDVESGKVSSWKGEEKFLRVLFEQISIHFEANGSDQQIALQVGMVAHRFK